MNKPLLIGLSGKSGSGKSTVADYLVTKHGYHAFAFADALKEMVGVAFNFNHEQLYGAMKQTVDPRWGVSPRWCLQWLGTEVMRSKFPDIWIRNLSQEIHNFIYFNGAQQIVVSDVRFKDEAYALKDMGAELWRLERNSDDAQGIPGHISENDLDDYGKTVGWDLVILNNSSLDQLFAMLDQAILA